ncbi:hypothetical protein LTR95_002575 [Oleoguttula sp. CCFEE 5521]
MTGRDEERNRTPKFSTFSSRKAPRDEPEPYESRDKRRNGDHHGDDHPRRHHSHVKQTHCKPTSRSTHYKDERSRQDRRNPSLGGYRVTRSRSHSPARLPSGREASVRRDSRGTQVDRYVPPSHRHPPRSPTQPHYEPSDFFVIDTKGDPDNVKYGRISKWSVPKYHLGGGGAVLGLDPAYKMDWAASTNEGYVLKRLPKLAVRPPPVSEMEEGSHGDVSNSEFAADDAGAEVNEQTNLSIDDDVVQAFEERPKSGLPIVTPKG